MVASDKNRIGFVSTRLAGTDGVSLEVAKWVRILTGFGYECFFFAGESEWPADHSYVVPEAHFKHPEIQALNADLFDNYTRSLETSQKVQDLKSHLKKHLYEFVRQFHVDLLIAENALSLPMNVPLGLALTEFIAENYFPTVAHHHDFAWERERYAITAADDYLRAAFPPTLRSIHHVVINSFAGRQLALRTGATSTLVPNVMDFDSPPTKPDAYAADLRSALGLRPDEYLLLQPTRIVPRKRIELAIELARRLDLKCALVISHTPGDEGYAYQDYLLDYANLMGVRVILASDIMNHSRGQTEDGRKIYSMSDIYQQADLVTYPSRVEGFGNAFLETIYYRRPIVMSTYEIFKTDIQPKGFRVIGFGDFITEETVRQARAVLGDADLVAEMTEHNYELGRLYYSYRTLETRLSTLISARLRVLQQAGGYGGYKRL
ncbi:MAG: glycosyltransferase family 4 protein [Chloroflexi bacterium]|nr:glycosyltransferase family 4 protein [Chloroflexota bacterium]